MLHIFCFFMTKTSSDQFRVWPFAKIFLYFYVLRWSKTTLNLRSLSFFVNYFIKLRNVHFFWYCIRMLVSLLFQGFDKYFCTSRFLLVAWWIHFNVTVTQSQFPWSIVKLTALIYQYLVWFTIRLNQNFLECISDCNTFFVFQWNNSCMFPWNINAT